MNPNSFGKGGQQQQQLPNGAAASGPAQAANAQAHNANQQQSQQAQQQQPQQQQNAVQPPSGMDQPFGSLGDDHFPGMNLDFSSLEGGDVLDNFDFDSFLNNEGDGSFGFDANLAFGDGLDAGIEGAN